MDKLELDARVERLERAVRNLAVLLIVVGLITGSLALMLLTASSRYTMVPPAATAATEVPHLTETTVAAPASMPMQVRDGTEGTAYHLATKFRELKQLRDKGLLTSSEQTAKKDQLLASPLRSTDLAADLEELGRLRDESLVSGDEFTKLKEKILGLGK